MRGTCRQTPTRFPHAWREEKGYTTRTQAPAPSMQRGNGGGTLYNDTAAEWKLSEYELQRTPHTTITDDRIVELPMQALDTELVCPICLSLCRNTMTTMECLHRFCGDCIMKSMRFDNREVKMCPTCRQPCTSAHRSLRPDPVFDGLIRCLYSDLHAYDVFQDEVRLRMERFSNIRALSESVKEGMRLQSLSRYGKRSAKEEPTGVAKQSKRSQIAAKARCGGGAAIVDLGVTVELRRRSGGVGSITLPEIRLRHLRVPSSCRIVHIVQFVTDQVTKVDSSLKSCLRHDTAIFTVGGRHVKLVDALFDLARNGHVVVHYGWHNGTNGAR